MTCRISSCENEPAIKGFCNACYAKVLILFEQRKNEDSLENASSNANSRPNSNSTRETQSMLDSQPTSQPTTSTPIRIRANTQDDSNTQHGSTTPTHMPQVPRFDRLPLNASTRLPTNNTSEPQSPRSKALANSTPSLNQATVTRTAQGTSPQKYQVPISSQGYTTTTTITTKVTSSSGNAPTGKAGLKTSLPDLNSIVAKSYAIDDSNKEKPKPKQQQQDIIEPKILIPKSPQVDIAENQAIFPPQETHTRARDASYSNSARGPNSTSDKTPWGAPKRNTEPRTRDNTVENKRTTDPRNPNSIGSVFFMNFFLKFVSFLIS